jgi:indolepyruvate ferredoxin oxidoreductase beta subunit
MTVCEVLAAAALHQGLEVSLFEGTGLTQRGGGVFGFVRFGKTHGSKIPLGEADGLISLEMSEVSRVIGYLKHGGEVWMNSARIPGFYTKLDPVVYPTQKSLETLVRIRTSRLHIIPADLIARQVGSPQAVNMVMLGAFCRADGLLRRESLVLAIQEASETHAALNLDAFLGGYEFAEKGTP